MNRRPSTLFLAALVILGCLNLRAEEFPSTMFALSPAREGSMCAEGGLVMADSGDSSKSLGIHAGWFLPGKDQTKSAEDLHLSLGNYEATARFTGFQLGAVRTIGDWYGIGGAEWIDHKVTTLNILWATSTYGPYIAGRFGTRQAGGFGAYARVGHRFGSIGIHAGYGTVSRWVGGISYLF